eukprot:3948962-Lingulodinium_polyedra.AAC.1
MARKSHRASIGPPGLVQLLVRLVLPLILKLMVKIVVNLMPYSYEWSNNGQPVVSPGASRPSGNPRGPMDELVHPPSPLTTLSPPHCHVVAISSPLRHHPASIPSSSLCLVVTGWRRGGNGVGPGRWRDSDAVSYTHLRAHETRSNL